MNNVSVVIVGVERSKFAGSCPGAQLDAKNMERVLKDHSDNVKLLLNEDATISNVKTAFEEAVKSNLAILFYSGHGGSEKFPDTGSEESDGRDEFLCLYDGYFRDNDLWEITKKAKGRVFEQFDCCHSQTMFKVPGFTTRNLPTAMPRGTEQNGLLVWSGCPDDTYSYGSATGGQMTNTFLKYYKKDLSYAQIWEKMKSDSSLKRYEIIQKTVIGNFPDENLIFS